MKRLHVIISMILLVASAVQAQGEDHKPSFSLDARAQAFVARHTREELSRDDVFIATLQDLARSDLSSQAKADAFTLMQERIGWLFGGTARLFPGHGYFQTQVLTAFTYFGYQQKMPEGLEVGPLLTFAKESRADHPMRGSNALLLATILNRRASVEAVRAAIDPRRIAAAQVPAIDLHNLAMAAALTADPRVVGKALSLLPETTSEESREDILSACGIYQNDDLRNAVEDFVRARFPGSFDNSVQTALMVLAHAGPPDHFRDFYKSLGKDKDKDSIEKLRAFWDSGFRDRLQGEQPGQSALKIWDGFNVKLENDGAWVSYGDTYRYWVSFK